jgi:hypothetical protein
MVQAFVGAQMLVAEASTRRADIVLRPLAHDAWWGDFTRPGKYIQLGRDAAEEQLSQLIALTKPIPDEPPKPTKTLALPAILRAA